MTIDSTTHIVNTNRIKTIKDFINALEQSTKASFGDLIKSVDVLKMDFSEVCSWSEDSYTRNCLICNDSFELILLCWEKGQITPIHDHGGEKCWVKIVQGKFEETIYETDEAGEPIAVKTNIGGPGGISYMVDFMGCHTLKNISEGRAMSLHLYAKPITSCNIYNEDNAQFQPKVMEYDMVFDDQL